MRREALALFFVAGCTTENQVFNILPATSDGGTETRETDSSVASGQGAQDAGTDAAVVEDSGPDSAFSTTCALTGILSSNCEAMQADCSCGGRQFICVDTGDAGPFKRPDVRCGKGDGGYACCPPICSRFMAIDSQCQQNGKFGYSCDTTATVPTGCVVHAGSLYCCP